jgi:hypothetical protein
VELASERREINLANFHFIGEYSIMYRVSKFGEDVTTLGMKLVRPECLKFIGLGMKLRNGIAIPLQAWTSPEGSRSLRLPDFKTIGT